MFERPTKEQVQVLSRTFVTWIVTVNAGENELFLSSSQINMVYLGCFSFNPWPLVDFNVCSWNISRMQKSEKKAARVQLRCLWLPKDTVSTVMYWIIWDLVDCTKELDVPPPIQSR